MENQHRQDIKDFKTKVALPKYEDRLPPIPENAKPDAGVVFEVRSFAFYLFIAYSPIGLSSCCVRSNKPTYQADIIFN